MPAVYPPIQFDPVLGTRQPTNAYPKNSFAPVRVGGNLYLVGPGGGYARIFKSPDAGATWSEKDAGHGTVLTGRLDMQYDAAAGLIRLWHYSIWPVYEVRSQTFDVTTDLFSAVTAIPYSGNFNDDQNYTFRAADGAVVLLYVRTSGDGKLYMDRYLAGVWDGPLALDTGTDRCQAAVFAYTTSTGILHVTEKTVNTGTGLTRQRYYQVNPVSRAVGAEIVVPLATTGKFTMTVFGTDLLVVSHRDPPGGPPVLLSTVLSPYSSPTPTLTQTAVTIDFNFDYPALFSSVGGATGLVCAATQRWVAGAYVAADQLLYLQTTNGVTWTSAYLLHDEIATPTFPGEPVQYLHTMAATLLAGDYLAIYTALEHGGLCVGVFLSKLTVSGAVTVTVPAGALLLSGFAPAAVNSPPAPAPSTVPGKRLSVPRSSLNQFDGCLLAEPVWLRCLEPEPPCCVPAFADPGKGDGWETNDFDEMPRHAVRFFPRGQITTPAPAAGDVPVLTFSVPLGYDGVITAHFHAYIAGNQLMAGSGDIVWRLRQQNIYPKHLGAMTLELGSQAHPFPVDGGLRLQSGQSVTYLVNVPNLSGAIFVGASWILCGLEGWLFPRRGARGNPM